VIARVCVGAFVPELRPNTPCGGIKPSSDHGGRSLRQPHHGRCRQRALHHVRPPGAGFADCPGRRCRATGICAGQPGKFRQQHAAPSLPGHGQAFQPGSQRLAIRLRFHEARRNHPQDPSEARKILSMQASRLPSTPPGARTLPARCPWSSMFSTSEPGRWRSPCKLPNGS
jgi:hypothetical protein